MKVPVTPSAPRVTPSAPRVTPSAPRVTLSAPRVTLSLSKGALAIAAAAVLLTGCASKQEKEADKITHAVINNNMDPVMKDLDSQLRAQITPIKVAQFSTELREAGAYKSIKEVAAPPNAIPGEHDFIATFEKHNYTETMVLDDDGHVRSWKFHMQDAAAKQ